MERPSLPVIRMVCTVRKQVPRRERLTLTGVQAGEYFGGSHSRQSNRVWMTISGYSTKKSMLRMMPAHLGSIFPDGLPAIPVNCIVYQNNSPDRLYVGTGRVYYMDNGTGQWVPYSDGRRMSLSMT